MKPVVRWLYETTAPLDDEKTDAVQLVGGKGASLRWLAASGMSVPSGFTITTSACRHYFEAARQLPPDLMDQVVQAVEDLERESHQSYGKSATPLLLAVRSGAAISMPGMLATILNCGISLSLAEMVNKSWVWSAYADLIRQLASAQGVEWIGSDARDSAVDHPDACRELLSRYALVRGVPFPQDRWELLRQSICAVFDSWHSTAAQAFRHATGGDPSAGTAVTVQVLKQTEVAGVLFSHDPLDSVHKELLIEAVPGSGKSLVDGSTTPHRFRVDRTTLAVTSRIENHRPPIRIDNQQDQGRIGYGDGGSSESLLSNSQLCELAKVVMKLEGSGGHPLDIEWGYSTGQLVLFQARPLRSSGTTDQDEIRRREVRRLERLAARHRTRLWVRHNLSETLPSPTPLTWDVVRKWMSGSGGYGQLYRQLGYRPSPRVCRHGFLDLIANQIYADPDRIAEIFGADLPFGYDLDELRRNPAEIQRAPSRFAPENTDSRFLLRLPGIIWSLWQSNSRLKSGTRRAADRFDREILPAYVTYLNSERTIDLTGVSDVELVQRLEDRYRRVMVDFAAEYLLPGLLGALAFSNFEESLIEILGRDEGKRLARALIAGIETQTGELQQTMLYRLAVGEITLTDFLGQFGHRGPGEMELRAPRWNEIPDTVMQAAELMLKQGVSDPRERITRTTQQRMRVVAELPEIFRQCGASSLYPQVQQQLLIAQRLLPYRETGKDYFMKGYELLRHAIRELARRHQLEDDIYFLRWNEVKNLSSHGPPAARTVERRRRKWYFLQRLPIPDTIDVSQLDELGLAPKLPGGRTNELCGLSLSNGIARGAVRVIAESAESFTKSIPHLPPGQVLVCEVIDPCFTPLLMHASGLIVERGGVLSHGAVVARQLGIPAVAVVGAIAHLRNGEMVEVDGDRGVVLRHQGDR